MACRATSSMIPVRMCSVGPVCPSLCLVDKYPCGQSSCLPRLLWFPALLKEAAFPPWSGAPMLCCPGPSWLWGCCATRCPLRCDRNIPTVPLPLTLRVPSSCSRYQPLPRAGGEFQASLQGMCGWMCALEPGPWGCVSAAVTELGGGSKPSLALLEHPRSPFCAWWLQPSPEPISSMRAELSSGQA